ncbi:hypothetical protein Z043_104458, partial [Scleropages formosus]
MSLLPVRNVRLGYRSVSGGKERREARCGECWRIWGSKSLPPYLKTLSAATGTQRDSGRTGKRSPPAALLLAVPPAPLTAQEDVDGRHIFAIRMRGINETQSAARGRKRANGPREASGERRTGDSHLSAHARAGAHRKASVEVHRARSDPTAAFSAVRTCL